MRGELELAAKLHTPRLRALPAFISARKDQVTLELRQPSKDRQHQSSVRRGGVGPSVRQRPEPRTSRRHSVEGVQQVSG